MGKIIVKHKFLVALLIFTVFYIAAFTSFAAPANGQMPIEKQPEAVPLEDGQLQEGPPKDGQLQERPPKDGQLPERPPRDGQPPDRPPKDGQSSNYVESGRVATPLEKPADMPAVKAAPAKSTILVDKKKVAFEAYLIDGNNYFKLRDLAYVLNGTKKQFEITWDAARNAIVIQTGRKYTKVGSEMTVSGSKAAKDAKPSAQKIIINGERCGFIAYNIGGSNYFRLRDIAEKVNFGVTWDSAAKTVGIDTSTAYSPEGGALIISLPFSETDTPNEMMPMGETIYHPDPPNPGGHPGIDFIWRNNVDIIASADGTVSKIKKSPNHEKGWDVYVDANGFYIGYTSLEKVDEKIKVGASVKAGQKIGEPGFFDNYMTHWEFGRNSIDGPVRICPMKYFDEASRQRILEIWANTKWEHKDKFPYICNYVYRCDYCIEKANQAESAGDAAENETGPSGGGEDGAREQSGTGPSAGDNDGAREQSGTGQPVVGNSEASRQPGTGQENSNGGGGETPPPIELPDKPPLEGMVFSLPIYIADEYDAVSRTQGDVVFFGHYIISPFGERISDSGTQQMKTLVDIEFNVKPGTKIKAPVSGKIKDIVPNDEKHTDYELLIELNSRVFMVFDHIMDIPAKKGDQIRAGQIIGTAPKYPYSGSERNYAWFEWGLRMPNPAGARAFCPHEFLNREDKARIESVIRKMAEVAGRSFPGPCIEKYIDDK